MDRTTTTEASVRHPVDPGDYSSDPSGVAPTLDSMLDSERRLDSPVFGLNSVEERLLGGVRRHGTFKFVAMITLAIALISTAMTMVGLHYLRGLSPETTLAGLVIGFGVPSIVAPPGFYAMVRLMSRLDSAAGLLRRAALTDPLTGVLNRRGFFEAIDEISIASSGDELEVVMVDIDDFKALNDRHGHATGDLVLIRVAEWLESLTGEAAIVARIGGDEFAVVFRTREGFRVPERQKLSVEAVQSEMPVQFEMTLGSSKFDAGDSFNQAMAKADRDLYHLKTVSAGSA